MVEWEANAIAGKLTKGMRRELLGLKSGVAGGDDWEQARQLIKQGLAMALRPAVSWIPCQLTPLGEQVQAIVKRELGDSKDKPSAKSYLGDPEADQ